MTDHKTNFWHYTTLSGLEGILKSQTLWASDYRYLNDSSEIIHSQPIIISELLPRIIEIVKTEYNKNAESKLVIESHGGVDATANEETKDIVELLYKSLLNSPALGHIPHVLSLCEVAENDSFVQKNGLLSQWRGYGNDGGYAVVVDKEKLIELFKEEDSKFYYGITGYGAIEYEQETAKISAELIEHLNNISQFAFEHYKARIYGEPLPVPMADNLSALTECMMRFKNRGFKEENEYRFYGFPYPERAKDLPGMVVGKKFKKMMTKNKEGTLVPYVELFDLGKKLPIKKIFIGPHRDKKLRAESIKVLLTALDLKISVECSEIPFVG